MGRPAAIYLPKPYCKNGHKRTAKNTSWRVQIIGKYEYRRVRCLMCEAQQCLARYYHNKKNAALRVKRRDLEASLYGE